MSFAIDSSLFYAESRRQLVVEILQVDARRADVRRTCTLPWIRRLMWTVGVVGRLSC